MKLYVIKHPDGSVAEYTSTEFKELIESTDINHSHIYKTRPDYGNKDKRGTSAGYQMLEIINRPKEHSPRKQVPFTLGSEYKDQLDLEVIKQQNRDTMSTMRSYLRSEARLQSVIETIKEETRQLNQLKPLFTNIKTTHEGDQNLEAILTIQDWHYGIRIDNMKNKFDVDIARRRIEILINETIRRCLDRGIEKLHVLNLGDLISGLIHLTIRVDNQIDVIQQTMEISEIVAEALNVLSEYFEIDYYWCRSNHSRVVAKKDESKVSENFDKITTWFLKERLAYNDRITIVDNEDPDDEIIMANIKGLDVLASHGDNDRASAIGKLVTFTNILPKLVFFAHLHHNFAVEYNGIDIFMSGSLSGIGSYAKKLRLFNTPSHNLYIIDDGGIVATERIPLV